MLTKTRNAIQLQVHRQSSGSELSGNCHIIYLHFEILNLRKFMVDQRSISKIANWKSCSLGVICNTGR